MMFSPSPRNGRVHLARIRAAGRAGNKAEPAHDGPIHSKPQTRLVREPRLNSLREVVVTLRQRFQHLIQRPLPYAPRVRVRHSDGDPIALGARNSCA